MNTNEIILRNRASFLNFQSPFSNFCFFNRNIKIEKDVFIYLSFDFVSKTIKEIIFNAYLSWHKNPVFKFEQGYFFFYDKQLFKIINIIKSQIWPIIFSKEYNNFNSFIKKLTNKKYDLILSCETFYCLFYFCCKKTKSSKKIWNGNHTLLARNVSFKHEDEIYRVLRIEEYNIKKNLIKNCDELYHQNEYEILKVKKNKPSLKCIDDLTIIFDMETMAFDSVHYPFMLCARTVSFNWPLLKYSKKKCVSFSKNEINNLLNNDIFNIEPTSGCCDVFYSANCFYERLNDNEVVDSFLGWCKTKILSLFRNDIIFYSIRIIGFNNNRFDNNFFLTKLRSWPNFRLLYNQRFNKISSIIGKWKIDNKIIYIHIDDLIKFLPDVSLKKACIDYNIKNAKLDLNIVNYNNFCVEHKHLYLFTKELDTIINDKSIEKNNYGLYNTFQLIKYYCEMDVESTAELYLKITSLVVKLIYILSKFNVILKYINFMRYISIPQMAFSIFKETCRLSDVRFLKFNDNLMNEFIISSCCGGRVNFGLLGEYQSNNLKYFDVTSEYPLSMTAPFPSCLTDPIINPNIDELNNHIQKCRQNRRECWNRDDFFNTSYFKNFFFGIFRVDIFPPENEYELIMWSPIALKTSQKNKYSNASQTNIILNSIHIRTLIFAGWNVVIKQDENNIKFTSTEYIFKPFINLMGTFKTFYKNRNKSFAKLCKMILNSVSGKLAQKPTSTFYIQESDTYSGRLTIQKNVVEKITDYSTSLHYLSTYVTGYANWILFSTAYKLNVDYFKKKAPLSDRTGLLIYTDTDSIVFDGNKTTFNDFKIDEEIGEWDEDKCDFNITWKEEHPAEIKRIIVLAKKSYCLFDNDKNTIDLKLKGIHTAQCTHFDWRQLKLISSPEYGSESINFPGLKREEYAKVRDIIKKISETNLKKTLSIEKDFTLIKSTAVDEINLYNYNKLFDSDLGFSHRLDFIQADLQ